jgi:Xaa-Pro aminopeptidase
MKYTAINSKLHSRNREKLVGKVKNNSIVIVQSNDQMPRNGDQFFPFRQNSSMFYFTGIEQEKSVLVIDKGTKGNKKEVLFLLKPNKDLEIWEGHKLTKDEATEISGVEDIRWLEEFNAFIQLKGVEREYLYLNVPENPKFQMAMKGPETRMYEMLKDKFPLHSYQRLAPIVQSLRVIKEHEELEILKKACKITKEAFLRVLDKTQSGVMEFEIEAEITYEFLKQGSSGHAYAPIVASGKNACVLHYIENNHECKSGELLLMDFGAEYGNYAADCSRTIPVNGKYTPRQRDLYEACLSVFTYARSLMVPGTSINEMHKKVGQLWENKHMELGLYSKADVNNANPDEPLWKKYYMHGTSHFLGLDVHDVGSKDQLFEPGMVLTCEPGIYIPDENVGIRLENDILITEEGNIDLMKDIPIEPDEIEQLMK